MSEPCPDCAHRLLWDEVERAAEEQDPGHLLRVNNDLRKRLDECIKVASHVPGLSATLAMVKSELEAALRVVERGDRLATILRAQFAVYRRTDGSNPSDTEDLADLKAFDADHEALSRLQGIPGGEGEGTAGETKATTRGAV